MLFRLSLGGVFALGFCIEVSSEVDMQFWKKPGYFDEYYQDLAAQGAKLPTIKSEEKEVLQTYHNIVGENQDARALAYLESAITRDASSALDFTLGLHYYRVDKLLQSLEYFKRAVRKWPTFQAAYKLIGYCYIQTDNWDEAGKAFNRATQLGEDDARTFGLLGMIYLNQDKILESESAYKRAIVADPNTLDWYKGLVSTLLKQEKHLESISLFEEMIARAEKINDQSDFLVIQANSFIALDMPLAAASNYEIVRRMGQGTSETMSRLGDIYLNENQIELGTEAHIDAIELDPAQDQDRPVNAAEVMVTRGYWKNGDIIIQTIRRVFADTLSEEHHLTLLRLEARISIAEQRDSATTIKLLEEILKLDPEDKETVLLLARYHYSQCRKSRNEGNQEEADRSLEEARKNFELAIELGDDEFKVTALTAFAQILVQETLYCDAIPILRDALDLAYTIEVEDYLERVERACRNQRISSR